MPGRGAGPRDPGQRRRPGRGEDLLRERLYEGREEVASRYPLGRLGEPADVAGAVSYLVSDDASWVTGQTLVVDGGVTLTGRGA
ncbi:SDR family oxidoreductase [Luedemannella flava]